MSKRINKNNWRVRILEVIELVQQNKISSMEGYIKICHIIRKSWAEYDND